MIHIKDIFIQFFIKEQNTSVTSYHLSLLLFLRKMLFTEAETLNQRNKLKNLSQALHLDGLTFAFFQYRKLQKKQKVNS